MIQIVLLVSLVWYSTYGQSNKPFAITLDGRVDSLEWKKAKSYSIQHGVEVKIMSDQNYIYVATRGKTRGWSHVYAKRVATVRVLHASAALGMAVYEAQKNSWKAVQSFEWELRDTSVSEGAFKNRAEYLKNNGWVATLTTMNANEQEFIISRALFDSTGMRIAVVRASDPKSPHYWPTTLMDGTLAERLIYGEPPENLLFDFKTWATLY